MIRIERTPKSSRVKRITFCRGCGTDTPFQAMICHRCGKRLPSGSLNQRRFRR